MTTLDLGTLGLRGTRAGGSFTWKPESDGAFVQPRNHADYQTRIGELLKSAPVRAALLPDSFANAEAARRIISDTLGGRDDPAGQSDLSRLNHPLGKIHQGRKTSPLRFRIVRLDTGFHIAALWDDRNSVTGNRPGDLQSVIDLLISRDKEIGKLMKGHL